MSNSIGEDKESTKAGLRAWWSSFTKSSKSASLSIGRDRKGQNDRVFGEPLRTSLKYASVAISMAGEDGQQYIWGYVPIIVAKVGLFLKENATEVEGVFRIAGSQKRMRELQETFDTGPRYGKNVAWEKYSVHDAASVLRRYLNQMPEPIVPLDLYSEFRNVMRKQPLDVEAATKTYRLLVASMPPSNQYLLLYVLDLLAVFARKSDVNRMTASNLAVIFQPGIFSHPSHLQDASEHKSAVEVLEFLIEHQDHFVIGLTPPPPANIDSLDLTSVSVADQTQGDPDVAELSDSDEELGDLIMHEGGGAKLGRRSTTASPEGPRGRKSGGLFKARRSVATTAAASEPKEDKSAMAELREGEQGDEVSSVKKDSIDWPQGEIREVGLMETSSVDVAGGLRRSRTVPSRRADKDDEGKRSASGTKMRVKRDRTTSKPEAATSPAPPASMEHKHAETSLTDEVKPSHDSTQPDGTQPDDPGLPTPPPSKILETDHKDNA